MAADTIDVPKLGPVNKKVLLAVGLAAAAFVAWRWWSASRTGTGTADATASDFTTDGLLPGVSGAVSGDGTIPSTGTGDTTQTGGTGPGHFANNAEWAAWATAELPTDKWTATDIVTALGAALARRPTDPTQQQIVQAAIAVAGEPPEGSIVLVSGGSTAITVAPSIVSSSSTPTSVTLTLSPVAGASSYVAYRSGASAPVGASSSTSIEIDGLTAGTSYQFTAAALSSSGAIGPKSAPASVKTAAGAAAAPAAPVVTKPTASTVTLTTTPIPGASSYEWAINGADHAHTSAPSYRYSTRKGATYRFSVRAIVGGHDTAQSPETTYTTK